MKQYSGDLCAVTVIDKRTHKTVEILKVTAEHPFFTTKGMVVASQFGIGTELVTRAGPSARGTNGSSLVVARVEPIAAGAHGHLVYNLEVEGDHTFFVGVADGGAWVHNEYVNLGDLTREEIARIQGVVDESGRPLEVAGSAARGMRRGVGSGFPIGKGPGTASDIDYLVPPGSMPYYDNLVERLPGIDPKSGIIPGVHNPFIGSAIRFEPGQPPVFVPGAK